MSLKDKIKQLINVIKDTDINQIEVSSFWGAQKIKLTKKITISNQNSNKSNQIIDEPLSLEETGTISTELDTKTTPDSDDDIIKADTEKEISSESTINEDELSFQKAPLVGTFYISSKPDEPAFIKKGDNVHKGQIICIIEAMKIFNEIESDFDGIVHEILIEDNSPVEFNQSIISIIPE